MQILVDADAMPVAVKEVLYRAAERTETAMTLVSNQPLRVPASAWIGVRVVEHGPDEADDWIAEQAGPGDLVVTADIPLAGRVVQKGARGLDPRGTLYTEETVHARLALRNLMSELRDEGRVGGGPAPYSKKDLMAFANALDRWLAGR